MSEQEKDWILRCAARPGAEWRILAHKDGVRVALKNEGTIDEVVVDHWLHLEQMDERLWWMRLGDARIMITVEPDGTIRVDIERGAYLDIKGETTEWKVPE